MIFFKDIIFINPFPWRNWKPSFCPKPRKQVNRLSFKILVTTFVINTKPHCLNSPAMGLPICFLCKIKVIQNSVFQSSHHEWKLLLYFISFLKHKFIENRNTRRISHFPAVPHACTPKFQKPSPAGIHAPINKESAVLLLPHWFHKCHALK